jgi:hypothetical protein
MLTIVVTGGRDYSDRGAVFAALDSVHAKSGIARLVHGGARGADTLAGDWAKARGIPCDVYPADWSRDGKRAGPIRNRSMLGTALPDGVVAFPGGSGTADCVKAAGERGIRVWQPLAPASQG